MGEVLLHLVVAPLGAVPACLVVLWLLMTGQYQG